MRRLLSLLPLAVLFSTLSFLRAQVTVSIDSERINFMLYAPVLVNVTIHNNTDHDLVLQNAGDQSWLSFIIKKNDGFPVHPDQKYAPGPVTLKTGEVKTVSVDLTPYYAFREVGNFRVAAVLDLPGEGQLISGNFSFNVNHGQKVWSQTRPIDGAERTFTLFRFAPDNVSTELYLRIDAPKENLIYATRLLGQVLSSVDPQTFFDADGQLHILHTAAQGTYRYTRINQNGVIENQSLYESIPEFAPRLVKNNDGTIMVVGGQIQTAENQRERLSDAKFGVNSKPKTPPADTSTPTGAAAH
jgi:hypothetical protein